MESAREFKKRILPNQDPIQNPNGEEASGFRQQSNSNQRILNHKDSTNQDRVKIDEIKILYCNADILTSDKKNELILDTKKQHPHIIAICEVKPKNGALRQLHEYEFDQYKIVSHTNMEGTTGRGVVILAHSSIYHLITDVNQSVNHVEFNEACIIEVRMSGNESMVFACIYRSPTKNDMSIENNTKLNTLIRDISSTKKYSHKCFVGDFNFPTINWNNWTTPHLEGSKEERFLDALRDSFLHQNVEEPTRCRGTDDPSMVDLILTGEANQAHNLEYLSPLGKSDHNVLAFSIKCEAECKPQSERYNYKYADLESMKHDLVTSDWDLNFVNTTDDKSTEELWQLFKSKVLSLRDRYVPRKVVGGKT